MNFFTKKRNNAIGKSYVGCRWYSKSTHTALIIKIEKKEKYLNKNNLDKNLQPEVPKLFYDYEKYNKYIEKFYRRNMLKREKSETERAVIVNILKVLLSTTDNVNNPNSGEYIKEFIPESKILLNLI